MKKWLLYSCLVVAVVSVLVFSACSGGGNTDGGSKSTAPTIAKVRIWLTLSNNPDDVHVMTLTPAQTVQASIWARGTTQENITFKVNLIYGGKLTTLATNVHTEGSSQAVAVGGFANELEMGDYTFQAISGAFGSIIGSMTFTVATATAESTPSATTPVSTLSEQPDQTTFSKYFKDMGLGKLPAGGKLPQDLQQNVTVFSSGDLISLYGTVIQEVQISARYYSMATKRSVDAGAPPAPLKVGGFGGSSTLNLSAGKYEYKVYVGDVLVAVFPFEVLAASSPTSPEQTDQTTFRIYFKDMGLGRLTGGGGSPQDLQQNVTVFAAGDQIVLYGNIVKECPQPRYEIYYVQADKVVKGGGLSFPTIKPGFDAAGFISVDTLDLPVGNYEYKVYVTDILVGVFPFEVR